MPRSTAKSKKTASGLGNIRKKTVIRNGQQYTYWEARYTEGYNSGTGKQVQRSITGKTQKEVAQKLKAATASLDDGTYIAPNKMTVAQWLDIWQTDYLKGVKPSTISSYHATVKNHIKPNIGAIRLENLTTQDIQEFYNRRFEGDEDRSPLSAKTIKNIHGILHKALQQAMLNNYIRSNPSNACILPRIVKKKIKPLNEYQIADFLKAIKGHKYEKMFLVALFTGIREGEVCGLQWECVDFSEGSILIDKQLQSLRCDVRGDNEKYALVPTKNSRERTITAAPYVMNLLWQAKKEQELNRKHNTGFFQDSNLVFTDEFGARITPQALYRAFKLVVCELGMPTVRFHDLRHSYAVVSLKAGDDIKTVQENLGHATAAFTLDVYGHVTEKMKKDSANRMQSFINSVC